MLASMSMKFRYKEIAPGYTRPIIPIEIINEKDRSQSIKYEVLVDSGADLNIFDAEIGEAIGIDVKSGMQKTVTGITSGPPEPYYLHKVIIKLPQIQYATLVGFKENMQNSYGVVGQRGFFDLLIVRFDFIGREIYLKIRT